jgi:ribosome-binding protein aMBF1 (putative translation factor)
MEKIDIVYNYDLLREKISENGFTQETLAPKLNMSRTSLNLKLNSKSNFTQTEMKTMGELLNIPSNEFGNYFFKGFVRKSVQKVKEVS